MTQRWVVSAAVLGVVAGWLWSADVAAQNAATNGKAGPIRKTADGHPDLSGLWLYFDETPLETPGTPMRRRVGETAETAGSSDVAQRAAQQRRSSERGGAQEVNPFYAEGPIRAKRVEKRASLVVDPPDGKVPVLPGPIAKQNYNTDHYSDSYLFLNPAERCITYGVPGSQFPSINASVQILQTAENIGFVYELNGARVVPINGSPHLPKNIRLWNGDSRAHWEGNTLVIDITNYNDKGQVTHSPDRLQGIIASEALHVVERYTPVDANTINYEVTVDDPNTFARTWKAAFPLTRDDGNYKVFEYVCHEGNLRFMNIVLGGGRLKDKGAGAEAAVASPSRKAAEESVKAPAK
jgi:hypothetical protein